MTVSATVKGGFWSQYGTTMSLINAKGPQRFRIAQWLSRKSLMALREKMETLDGAAAGSTASKTLARVEANSELGGKRTVETETLINTATVSGDITEINNDLLALSTRTYDSTPVANGDKNPLGTR